MISQQQIPKKRKKSPTLKNKISRTTNHWSLISFNINGLNSPIKKHRLTDWIQKQNASFCSIQETHPNLKDRHRLKVKSCKKFFQSNGPKKPKKETGVEMLKSPTISVWDLMYDLRFRSVSFTYESAFVFGA